MKFCTTILIALALVGCSTEEGDGLNTPTGGICAVRCSVDAGLDDAGPADGAPPDGGALDSGLPFRVCAPDEPLCICVADACEAPCWCDPMSGDPACNWPECPLPSADAGAEAL